MALFTALGNAQSGVRLKRAPSNTIGGSTAAAGNLISGNQEHGIIIFEAEATGNIVQGNLIGTDANGAGGLGNGNMGVRLRDASSNTVGGTAAGQGNTIASNARDGVSVAGTAVNNAIQRNSIFANRGLATNWA